MRNVKGSLLSASLAAVFVALFGPAAAQAQAQPQAPAHNMATMKMSPVDWPEREGHRPDVGRHDRQP